MYSEYCSGLVMFVSTRHELHMLSDHQITISQTHEITKM